MSIPGGLLVWYRLIRIRQNMARQRALEFGKSDILRSMDASNTEGTTTAASISSSTLVVRSSASNSEVLGTDPSPDDELKTKPRGFFADQFEVGSISFDSRRGSQIYF